MNTTENRQKSPDEIFCPSCGAPVKREAVMCVHCGIAFQGPSTRVSVDSGKTKTPAVLLAVFLGYWAWLYTFGFDWWKFLIGLICNLVAIAFAVAAGAEGEPAFGVVAGLINLAIWVWTLIHVCVRSRTWYASYGNWRRLPGNTFTSHLPRVHPKPVGVTIQEGPSFPVERQCIAAHGYWRGFPSKASHRLLLGVAALLLLFVAIGAICNVVVAHNRVARDLSWTSEKAAGSDAFSVYIGDEEGMKEKEQNPSKPARVRLYHWPWSRVDGIQYQIEPAYRRPGSGGNADAGVRPTGSPVAVLLVSQNGTYSFETGRPPLIASRYFWAQFGALTLGGVITAALLMFVISSVALTQNREFRYMCPACHYALLSKPREDGQATRDELGEECPRCRQKFWQS